jgi:hypothetical protein
MYSVRKYQRLTSVGQYLTKLSLIPHVRFLAGFIGRSYAGGRVLPVLQEKL